MLSPDKAREQLEKIKVDQWIDQRLARLAKLPSKHRPTARIILGHEASGKSMDWEARAKVMPRCKLDLRRMKAGERLKVFQSLFGDLAPAVQKGWDMIAHMPYSSEYDRKAFRAPGLPEVVDERRMEWLSSLCTSLEGYAGHQDIQWVAAWAPHLDGDEMQLGILLAAAIDLGGATGQSVLEILIDSAKGEHDVGRMGRHVTQALLCCSNPRAWEFMEKLLVAAQRQEGLRQSILETIDMAHPQAFARIMRVILENNLARFSATVRAVDVWFGFQWDAVSTKKVNEVIASVLLFLDDEKARKKALDGDDPEQAFLALWCLAYQDVQAAIPVASKMLRDKREGNRFVAAHLLHLLDLDVAKEAILPAFADEDLRVAAQAIKCFVYGADEFAKKHDLFGPLDKLFARAPEKKTTFKPIVWPWWKIQFSKHDVANVMDDAIGDGPVNKLIPFLPYMNGYTRSHTVDRIVAQKKFDAPTRAMLFSLVTDNQCREGAIKGLAKCRITEAEAIELESLLARKNSDLRRAIIGVLEGQGDAAALASAQRLTGSRDKLQRLAGLELLRRLVEAKRMIKECRALGQTVSERGKVTHDEQVHLEAILSEQGPAVTLDDALGLLNASQRTAPQEPRKLTVAFCTPAARAILEALDGLVHKYREESVFIPAWDADLNDDDDDEEGPGGTGATGDEDDEPKPVSSDKPKGKTELLGSVGWRFPSTRPKLPLERDLERLPLCDVWRDFWSKRPAAMRDKDGLELLRAQWLLHFCSEPGEDYDPLDGEPKWLLKLRTDLLSGLKPARLKYKDIIEHLLPWLPRLDPPDEVRAADFLLDGLEAALSLIPRDRIAEIDEDDEDKDVICRWRNYDSPVEEYRSFVVSEKGNQSWDKARLLRRFRLLRWWDQPVNVPTKLVIPRERPDWSVVQEAFLAGACTEADVVEHLLGPRPTTRWGSGGFDDLSRLTAPKPPKVFAQSPVLADIVLRCRARVLDVELKRGDSPTVVSAAAGSLGCSGGLDTLARVLEALGDEKLSRGTRWGDQGKPRIFSHLIQVSIPGPDDTRQAFVDRMTRIQVKPERLVEVAVYAPQWAGHVEAALGWAGLEDAIWWIHAHTRDTHWEVDDNIRAQWEAAVRQRTPLAGKNLLEGAVDVAWFHRAYTTLGKARWDQLYEAAKYASRGTGHVRAQLFADAMLGRLKKSDLIARVTQKRNQDAVRALGLLPLAGAPRASSPMLSEAARKDLQERYRVLQEFLRGSRQFGSMRQASEKRACAIGMENLARTAGYPDPVRLQWAMEAEETRDLARGPITASAGDIAVCLSIDDEGKPDITVQNTKTGRTLASIPPQARKQPKIAELVARRTDLKRSASRMRLSLENAMCRGDVFSGTELRQLHANPLLLPLLRRVVFAGDGILGYPVDGGQGLVDFAGKIEPVKKDESLRIAHPIDLLATRRWDRWQHDCFARERVQPFKQIFRELYVPTRTELAEGDVSRRYAGHQVNPRQAMALLTSRGWVAAPEEGVFRTFHDLGLIAWVTFEESFFTPAEVEGLTLEGVWFVRREKPGTLRLKDVPPRVFSEVMRDLDLVVSVAHRGGVDPEASASTVEMRASLLRETCALLSLKNVQIKENHALIAGSLGNYAVHLGSAVTHRHPGGALFIVAVHSQHRGRLFLPFADDDPRTAEVISKVLLLARDNEIQDPNLLAQIAR